MDFAQICFVEFIILNCEINFRRGLMGNYMLATPEMLAETLFKISEAGTKNAHISFASDYDVAENGELVLGSEESFYGAEIISRYDGCCLFIGMFGGGDWYVHDASEGATGVPSLGSLTIAFESILLHDLTFAREKVALQISDDLVEWNGDAESGTWISTCPHTDSYLEKAWHELEDITFESDDSNELKLVAGWKGFPKGTSRDTIWGFFNASHSKGIEYLHNMIADDFTNEQDDNGELCECEYCKVEIPWGGSESSRGAIWSCEKCGNYFCESCFVETHGVQTAHEMFSMDGNIKDINCLACYQATCGILENHKEEKIYA